MINENNWLRLTHEPMINLFNIHKINVIQMKEINEFIEFLKPYLHAINDKQCFVETYLLSVTIINELL